MKATNISPADINRCNELMPEDVRTTPSPGTDTWGFPWPLPDSGAACDKPAGHPGEDHAWRRAMRPAVEWPNTAVVAGKFQVGDKVVMAGGVPFVVEVLEIGACPDGFNCTEAGGGETFRFADPGGMGDDWAHSDDFEKVG